MKKYIWPALRLVIAALVIWGGWTVGSRQWRQWFPEAKKETFVPTATVKKQDLVLSIKELGNVEAERSITITSEIEGKIISMAKAGRTVKPGELLVQLDDTPLRNEVRNTTLEYSNAQAQVKKAQLEFDIQKETNKTEVEQQQAQLDFDKTELDRSKAQLEKKKRLAADKLVPQSDVEVAEIDVRSKEFNVKKGEATLALKKKSVQSTENQKLADVRNVEFTATIAKSKRDEAASHLTKARITAPAGGLVVINKTWTADGRREFKEGDGVYPRQQILQLPDLSSMLVKVQVDEADIARVRVGQKVRLTLDALPGKKFSGLVKEISNLASEAMPWETSSTPGRKNFEVTVQVIQKGATPLRPGMTANAEIISDVVSSAVCVPIESVIERNGGKVVYVKTATGYKTRPVEVGKQNETSVVIKKGLRTGDVVALRDPFHQQEGGEQEKAPAGQKGKPAPLPVPARKKAA